MNIKVKPLQWEQRSESCFLAETIAGAYWVDKPGPWVGYLEADEKITPMAAKFRTEQSAKVACEAHWNALVLSLLNID